MEVAVDTVGHLDACIKLNSTVSESCTMASSLHCTAETDRAEADSSDSCLDFTPDTEPTCSTTLLAPDTGSSNTDGDSMQESVTDGDTEVTTDPVCDMMQRSTTPAQSSSSIHKDTSGQRFVLETASCTPLLLDGGIHTSLTKLPSMEAGMPLLLDNFHASLSRLPNMMTPAQTMSDLHLDRALHCSLLALDARSDNNSAFIPFCRICHQPGGEGQEMLISPCRCAGTLQNIHNTCLMRWLEIMTKRSRKPPKCELCHYQYHRHKKFNFHKWRWPRVTRGDKVLHIIFLIMLVIMVVCAVATVMCFLSDKGQISKFPRNKQVDLTTEEIITLSCGVLFFVSFFVAMSVQIKARHTIYQLIVKFIMRNMEWEIDEYDKSKDSLFSNKDKNFV